MKKKSKSYNNYEEFVVDFKKIFESDNTVKSLELYKAPVRIGKTYFCEKHLRSLLSERDSKKITLFLTTKNLLCDESFSAIYPFLTDTYEKDRLFLINQDTSSESIKELKEMVRGSTKQTLGNIAIITNYAYFTGDRISNLAILIYYAKKIKGYKLSFLLDEAEGFVNGFHQKLLLSRPVSRNFGRPLIGNNTISINKNKARLSSNKDLKYDEDSIDIYGSLIAREGNMMTFDSFQFVNNAREEEDPNSGRDLRIKFTTKKTIFQNMSIFNEIRSISLVDNILNYEEIQIFTIDDNNELTISEDLFQTLEKFYNKYKTDVFFTLICFIEVIIKSNEVYLHHKCVTSKNSPDVPLNYSQATKSYEDYLSQKANNPKYKLSEELNVPMFGKLYELELKFVNSCPLTTINKFSDKTIMLSATWNEWLLDSTIDQLPYYLRINNTEIRKSLLALIYLIRPEKNEEKTNNLDGISVEQVCYDFSKQELLRSLSLQFFDGDSLKNYVKKLM